MTRLPLLLALLTLSCAGPVRVARVPQAGQPVFRVMTYNVNYGLGGDPATLATIASGGADLVLLQETTPRWERALRGRLSHEYPHMAFVHAGGAGGLAVLSRHPFDTGEVLPPEVGWFAAWRVIVQSPIGPVQALSVHLRPPVSDGGSFVAGYFTTDAVREAEIMRFADTLDPALPTLVAGDFNEDEHGDAVAVLESRGMRSALPEFAPDATTWRWPLLWGELTSRLDHLVYDERLEPLDAKVLMRGRSDHFPVVATFAVRK